MGTKKDAMDFQSDFRSLFDQKEKELVRLCVQKERELAEMCEQQVKNLQQQVLDRDENIADLNAKLCSLKVDFKYNLELLDGRDVELSQYELELSALQESVKQATKNIQETHEKLAESERQRLQERTKAEEKDKLYQRTLLDMRGQMESLQLTKEQLLTMHKQAVKTACAELKSEVEIKQVDLELHSKRLEAHTLERIRIQELQSQLVLDGVKNKLSVAETTIKEMERKREVADEEYSQAVEEMRDFIRERDKIIKQMSAERQQLQSEKDDIKSKAEVDSRKSKEKLQYFEAAHQQVLQMKSQIEELQRRLESGENRLTRFGEQPWQLDSYVAKVGELEKEVMTYGNKMNTKIESVEACFREAVQLQNQKMQELKAEVAWWKSQHDVLLSKYTSQQKSLAGGSTVEELKTRLNFLQVPQVDTIGTKQDVSTTTYNLERIRPNITNIPFPHPQHSRGSRGTTNSFGSSLPSPSPLPSPTFSNLEDILQLRQVNEAIQTNKQENDVVMINTEDECMPQTSKRDDENLKLVSLAKENQDLRSSMQNLKHQNEQMRSVVGTMLEDMEALRKAALQKENSSNNIEGLSTKCDGKEVRQLREEVHDLASELQKLRLKKSDEKTSNQEDQTTEAIQNKPNICDKSKSVSDDIQPAAVKIAELERVQKVLQIQLESATTDIIRMTNERDCLMEISNSLHADFNRFVQQSDFKNNILFPGHYDTLEHTQNPTRNMATSGGRATTTCSHRPYSSPPKAPNKTSAQRVSSPTTQDWGREASTTRGSKQGINMHTQSRSLQPNEAVDDHIGSCWLHLEGKMTSLKQRPEVPQDYVHKGIPSQRNKLKQSIKLRETQLANQIASRPRVRNYNIKDDDA